MSIDTSQPPTHKPDAASYFTDIPFVCCQGPQAEACLCGAEESTLRRYAAGEQLRAMTPQEREWCVDQADRAGEGYYNAAELQAMSDQGLGNAVLNAWSMYVQSQL